VNEREIVKIRGFINEKEMSEAVRVLLMRNFLAKKTNADVYTLAAQTLAVQFLSEAWVEMERHKNEPKKEGQKSANYL